MDPPFSPFPGLLSSISVPGLLPEDGKLESLPPTPITPAFAWPTTTSNKPKIILIFGGLGAGKSEACTKLTKELPVHVLSVDGLLKNFAKARPETLHDRFITDKMTSEKFSSRYKPLRAELIVDMLNDELKRIAKKDHKVIAHFILGFPRDEEQRELFIHKVGRPDRVIWFDRPKVASKIRFFSHNDRPVTDKDFDKNWDLTRSMMLEYEKAGILDRVSVDGCGPSEVYARLMTTPAIRALIDMASKPDETDVKTSIMVTEKAKAKAGEDSNEDSEKGALATFDSTVV